jgi:hypothetical protein
VRPVWLAVCVAVFLAIVIPPAIYSRSVTNHYREKAVALDRGCRRVNNALRVVQLDLRSHVLHDAGLRIGRDAGVTFEEISNCMLADTEHADAVVAPISACIEERDDACLDREITELRSKLQAVIGD